MLGEIQCRGFLGVALCSRARHEGLAAARENGAAKRQLAPRSPFSSARKPRTPYRRTICKIGAPLQARRCVQFRRPAGTRRRKQLCSPSTTAVLVWSARCTQATRL